MKKKLVFAMSVLGLGLAVQAQALVSVNPLLVFLGHGATVQDITVTNDAASTAYVEVLPSSVQHPGASNQSSTLFNPSMNVSNFGLMVSPLKMAIPANSYRKVRVVALNSNPSIDMVYYLQFKPVASLGTDVSVDGTTLQMSNTVTYRVQTVVLPMNPMPKLSLVRNGVNVAIANTGNSYASLRNGQICDTQGNNCKALPSALTYKVLYAGNTWQLTLPSAGVVKFNVVYAQDKAMNVSSN